MTWWTEEETPRPRLIEVPAPAAIGSSAGGAGAGPTTFGAASAFYLYIYGKKGQGKTLYLRDVYRAAIAGGRRGVFIDTTGRNGDLGQVVTTVQEVAQAFAAGARSLVFQPGWDADISALWKYLFELGHVVIAADEAQSFAGPGSADKHFLRLNQLGRNKQIDFLTTAQGPTDLHPKLRQNYDAVVTFRQGTPAYAEQIATDFFKRPELRALLLELPQYIYLRVDAEGNITRGEVAHPWDQAPALARAA